MCTSHACSEVGNLKIHFDIWQNQYNIVKLYKIKLEKIKFCFGQVNLGLHDKLDTRDVGWQLNLELLRTQR